MNFIFFSKLFPNNLEKPSVPWLQIPTLLKQTQVGDVFVWLSILLTLCKWQVGDDTQYVRKEINAEYRTSYNTIFY